ncbi:ABC transporter substrate-binding protein [Azospirillum canadense]|uniref:ABC transporter substrate-binding protein n=1 Tax=Azospirillum canadense TaxID=403962 RepID=UPI002227A7F0|nr:ABC transporter substrate-binding protein [Azospirillum canadense]MCW2240519.1 peptide/nickel transport system substrate-binding protein [Azospirillum canadense]
MLGTCRCVAVLAALALGITPVAAQTPKGTLVFASGGDADTLDPHFILERPDVRVSMHIHENLVNFDQNGELKPELAESWSVSDDRLTWTFNLRKGVTFHDGTPFNAEAVKQSFERILDPATASPRRSIASVISAVKVIDEYTVALITDKPFAPLPSQVSMFNLAIVGPAAKTPGADYARKPVGTGPFKFAAWQVGEKITLVRNEAYWGPKPAIERIEFRVVPEDSARVLQLMSGEADVIANVPPAMLPQLKSSSAVKVIQETSFRTVLLGVNNKIKPFDDLRVRQALAHAIDTSSLVKGVLRGIPKHGGGIEAPDIPGARKDLPPYAHDTAKARRLLAEAGYPNGFSTTLMTPTGRFMNDRQLAEAIQAQAREVGIDIKIEAPEWATYNTLLNKREVPLFLSTKGNPTGDLDLTMHLVAHSAGQMNFYNWKNPKADQLIETQRGTTDREQRYALLSEIQQSFYDEVPAIVLFYDAQLYAARSNVTGVRVQPNETVTFTHVRKN